MKENLHANEEGMFVYFHMKNYIMVEYLKLLDRDHHRNFPELGGFFCFIIIGAVNSGSHTCAEQVGRIMFRAVSETVGNSALISSQNSLHGIL